jgi:hypothetical protein
VAGATATAAKTGAEASQWFACLIGEKNWRKVVVMKTENAIQHFGGRANLLRALRQYRETYGGGIAVSTVYTWKDLVPRDVALELHVLTQGSLDPGLADYVANDKRRINSDHQLAKRRDF